MRSHWLLSALCAVTAASAQDGAQNNSDSDSLLWGAYRSNLYFGMRPRIPQSLMTGLMWFGTQDYQSFTKTRHSCEQGDNLQSYTWTNYDAREGGTQVLNDAQNNVKVTTELLKVPGGEHGGSWAVRIKGTPLSETQLMRTSFIYYLGLEGMGGIDMDTELQKNGLEGDVKFSGYSPDLDEFTIRIVDGPDNTAVTSGPASHDFAHRLGKTHIAGVRVVSGDVWKAKELLSERIFTHARAVLEPFKEKKGEAAPDPSFTLQLPDEVDEGATLFGVQKSFEGPFQFDIFFESKSAGHQLSSAMLDSGMPALSAKLTARFEDVFPVPPGPDHDSLLAFSQALTSNIVGGVGYFYGRSIVDTGFAYEWDQEDDDDEETARAQAGARMTEPRALLTATPSRSFFPRGFYWDEGFHLLHIGEWDNDLSLEILTDWIGLIDADGWVAREQILGEEARSKVPAEFQTQVPRYANPPTLTMAVTAYIARLRALEQQPSSAELGLDSSAQVPLSAPPTAHPGREHLRSRAAGVAFLRSIYGPLRRHYDWFRRTQRGALKAYGRRAASRTEAYRWRGRSAEHVLTSGMDDYPRARASAGELHLDLHCWMGFFSRTMREIAEFIGVEEDAELFAGVEKGIKDNLEDLHWSEEQQMYCDVGLDDDDEDYHECNRGYLSLFPLMLELLPADSPRVGAILTLLRDPAHLWSPHGLRSLSASHPLFGAGENYWKGPVWVQMNYLVLRALHTTYAAQAGPYQAQARAIYDELRANVIKNVHEEYKRTGYVWEQYDATTGKGQRSHPFTGWTSMVTLIISEKY